MDLILENIDEYKIAKKLEIKKLKFEKEIELQKIQQRYQMNLTQKKYY